MTSVVMAVRRAELARRRIARWNRALSEIQVGDPRRSKVIRFYHRAIADLDRAEREMRFPWETS